MDCLLGRVQTSLALLSLHFAIATPKINFCHLPVGTVRVRCNEGVPCGTPSLCFIAELWREANGYGSLTSTTYPLLYSTPTMDTSILLPCLRRLLANFFKSSVVMLLRVFS